MSTEQFARSFVPLAVSKLRYKSGWKVSTPSTSPRSLLLSGTQVSELPSPVHASLCSRLPCWAQAPLCPSGLLCCYFGRNTTPQASLSALRQAFACSFSLAFRKCSMLDHIKTLGLGSSSLGGRFRGGRWSAGGGY